MGGDVVVLVDETGQVEMRADSTSICSWAARLVSTLCAIVASTSSGCWPGSTST